MAAVIDHLIYAVRDLDAAAERLEAMGLASYFGGSHPGWGTSNRIVPLGPSYIELLGPAPFESDRFMGWMLRGVPMPAESIPMQRVQEDGALLSWRLAGPAPAPSLWELDPVAPVYIEWDAGTTLPGMAAEPVGRLEAVEFSPAAGVVAATVLLSDGRQVTLR